MKELMGNCQYGSNTLLALLLAGILVAGTSLAEQTARSGNTLHVGEDATTCDYLDLQAAIDAASSGDTIRLSGSTAHHSGNTYSIHAKSLSIQGGLFLVHRLRANRPDNPLCQ